MIEQLLTVSSSEEVRGVEFLGQVEVADFTDGLTLASAIGLEAGTAQYSDSPWLHFILDGVELYVAKRTYRSHISWNHIDAADAVFGSRTVVIKGKTYKVRLLKTAIDDVYTGGDGTLDPVGAYGSEWNRLFYPIYGGKPSQVSGEGINFGSLAQYTDADLVSNYGAGNGYRTWCQETPSGNTGMRVLRGLSSVSNLNWGAASAVTLDMGWRPVLELVQ